MKKPFIIAVVIMIILGVTLPYLIPKTISATKSIKQTSSKIESSSQIYKNELNDIKNSSFLPQGIQKMIDRFLNFI